MSENPGKGSASSRSGTRTGVSSNGADPAEETVVDMAAKKTGAEDTVSDGIADAPETWTDVTTHTWDPVPRDHPSEYSEASDASRAVPETKFDIYTSAGREPEPSAGKTFAMDSSTPSQGFGASTTRTAAASAQTLRGSGLAGTAASSSGIALAGSDDTSSRPPKAPVGKRTPRKAHLQVSRFEPWSVMKFSFVMSMVCFVVLFIAVAVLYMILSSLGVFDALTATIRDLTASDPTASKGGIDPASWFSATRILTYTVLIGALNVLLITALATVWSVIYNLAADFVGGIEVTLKEAE